MKFFEIVDLKRHEHFINTARVHDVTIEMAAEHSTTIINMVGGGVFETAESYDKIVEKIRNAT